MSEKRVRATRGSPERHPGSKWCILAKDKSFGAGALIVDCDGEQALPVFSGEGEAEMFVWLGGAFEDGWRVRASSAGELVSILYGPCAGVGRVALDPSPEMTAEAIRLVSVSRGRFVSWIIYSSRSYSPGSASQRSGCGEAPLSVIGRAGKYLRAARGAFGRMAAPEKPAGAPDAPGVRSTEASPKPPKEGFRPDVEGLRAVAVGVVLLYHAGVPFAPGGYVGVDVFFVISGFLITGLLIRELEKTDKISLTRFYSRRAKRLLPLTVVVLAFVVHGGGWRSGERGEFPSWDAWLAEESYVVFDIDYRLSPPPTWQTAPADVACAVGWVKENSARYNVDPERIALMGRSAGGQLALLTAYGEGRVAPTPGCAARKVKDTGVDAIAAFYPPTDLSRLSYLGYLPGVDLFLGGSVASVAGRYRDLSPVTHVDSTDPPTFLAYGGDDRIVPPEQSELLGERLRKAGVTHRLVELPWANHTFDFLWGGWGSQITRSALEEFLEEHL